MEVKPDILYFYHATHTPFLHARGIIGTDAMIDLLELQDKDRVLDFGCGTGSTMVRIISRDTKCDLYGFDKSKSAMRKTTNRLRFCGIVKKVTMIDNLKELDSKQGTFDVIYIESVLTVLSKERLMKDLHAIKKLIKPGGRLICIETIWDKGIVTSEKIRINLVCEKNFGIPQCSLIFRDLESSILAIEKIGFSFSRALNLDHVVVTRGGTNRLIDYLSICYSAIGKFRSFFRWHLLDQWWRLNKVKKELFADQKKYLTGHLLEFRKGIGH